MSQQRKLRVDRASRFGLFAIERRQCQPHQAHRLRQRQQFGEQGLPDFDASAWNVIVLPKDTPRDIADRLHTALFEALDTPTVRDRLNQMGASVVPKERRSAAYLQKWVETEIAKWAGIVKAAGITPQ